VAAELAELVVRVDRIFRKGGKTGMKRGVVAVWRRPLPATATTWLSDSTADPDELRTVVPGLIDSTPAGRLAQQHPVWQVPFDVMKSSSARRALAVIRGILEAFPHFRRVGIIVDKRHAPAVRGVSRKGENLEVQYLECESRRNWSPVSPRLTPRIPHKTGSRQSGRPRPNRANRTTWRLEGSDL